MNRTTGEKVYEGGEIKKDIVLKNIKPKINKGILYKLKPYIFLLPALMIIGYWFIRPLIETFFYAFTKWSMVPGTTPVFVGLQNFIKLLGTPNFYTAIKNTLFYIVGMLPFSIIIPLFLAVATDDLGDRAKKIYRALFFIPMIMAPVSSATIWRWLFHPSNGLITKVLIGLGITDSGIAFFMDANWAKVIILLITGWKMIGFSTIMFSAALTGVDTSCYEAASLDGSTGFRRFKDITLPLISPTVVFVLMMSILFASQWTFSYIDLLTSGGPYGTSTNIYYEMYTYGFTDLNIGMSSASAMLFLLIFGIIAFGLMKFSKRISFYDN